MADQYGYVCGNLIVGILQLNLIPASSLCLSSNILFLSFTMSASVEYHDSMTPEPYALALTPPSLMFEEYKALELEQSAAEEKYDEVVNKHNEWKAAKKREEKEAWAEKLKKEKEACLLKVETLRKEKLEAERRAEEKRKAEEKKQEDERITRELKEQEEAAEHKRLADLKEKENEANEAALQAAGALLASDRDSEVDPADPKTTAMDELRRRQRITKGKKKADVPEPRKCKVRSASTVEDSDEEAGGASVGPSTPKRLKTEPVPRAEDKVFSGHGA